MTAVRCFEFANDHGSHIAVGGSRRADTVRVTASDDGERGLKRKEIDRNADRLIAPHFAGCQELIVIAFIHNDCDRTNNIITNLDVTFGKSHGSAVGDAISPNDGRTRGNLRHIRAVRIVRVPTVGTFLNGDHRWL